MTPATPEALLDALQVLRDARDPFERRLDPQWRVIDAFLRATYPSHDADADEMRQRTLLAVARTVRSLEAKQPLQAAKWIATIHRNKRVDYVRVRARDPVARGLAAAGPGDDAAPGPLERLESPDRSELAPDVVERVLGSIEDHVAAYLESNEPSPAVRHLRRLQARAALHRLVLDAELEEIVPALDAGEPLSRDRVYKWVERGRKIVLAGLEHWIEAEGRDGPAAEIAAGVREIVERRRVDAGKARPDRRKERSDDP